MKGFRDTFGQYEKDQLALIKSWKTIRALKIAFAFAMIAIILLGISNCYLAYNYGKYKRQSEDLCEMYNKLALTMNDAVESFINPYLEIKSIDQRITAKLSTFEDCKEIK